MNQKQNVDLFAYDINAILDQFTNQNYVDANNLK